MNRPSRPLRSGAMTIGSPSVSSWREEAARTARASTGFAWWLILFGLAALWRLPINGVAGEELIDETRALLTAGLAFTLTGVVAVVLLTWAASASRLTLWQQELSGSLRRFTTLLGLHHDAKGWVRHVFGGAGAGIWLAIIVGFGVQLLPWEPPALDPRQPLSDDPAAGVVAALTGPAVEEVAWRVPLLALLHLFAVRLSWPAAARFAVIAAAVLLQGVLFGCSHADFSTLDAVATGFAGIVWGTLAVVTRSVVAPLLSHTTYNLVAYLL